MNPCSCKCIKTSYDIRYENHALTYIKKKSASFWTKLQAATKDLYSVPKFTCEGM